MGIEPLEPLETLEPTPVRGRLLLLGRSSLVLAEAADVLRRRGYVVATSSTFDRVAERFDVAELDVIFFGGMVPPSAREEIRADVTTRSPRTIFVEGLAGIAGLIADQIDGVLGAHAIHVAYDGASRTVDVVLDATATLCATAYWGTSFVPPHPRSDHRVLVDARYPAGAYRITVPAAIPHHAAFLSVRVAESVESFPVGTAIVERVGG